MKQLTPKERKEIYQNLAKKFTKEDAPLIEGHRYEQRSSVVCGHLLCKIEGHLNKQISARFELQQFFPEFFTLKPTNIPFDHYVPWFDDQYERATALLFAGEMCLC